MLCLHGVRYKKSGQGTRRYLANFSKALHVTAQPRMQALHGKQQPIMMDQDGCPPDHCPHCWGCSIVLHQRRWHAVAQCQLLQGPTTRGPGLKHLFQCSLQVKGVREWVEQVYLCWHCPDCLFPMHEGIFVAPAATRTPLHFESDIFVLLRVDVRTRNVSNACHSMHAHRHVPAVCGGQEACQLKPCCATSALQE